MRSREVPPRAKDSQRFLEVAILAAKKAARIQKEAVDKPHTIAFKGMRDIVTEVDRACEAIIVKTIRPQFPDHDFLLEETAFHGTGSPYLWNIDPLDGTINFSHRIPHFCCSIALEYKGAPLIAVVLDPISGELFTAVRSKGAYLNGKRIHVSKEARLIRCILATGFPNNIHVAREKNLKKFSRMLYKVQGIRRTGSAALDLCYVAAGRLDGYWIIRVERWDAAAGILIAQEAGGRVTDLHGNSPNQTTKHFIVSNGKIHKELVKILNPSH